MNPAMDISPDGVKTLMSREGVRLIAYRDSVGVWTIGVGHTAAAGPPAPSAGMEISRTEAMAIYTRDLRPYIAAVNSAVHVECSQSQFDAMVSLCFNIGQGGFSGSSVVRRLNAGDVVGAADAFLMWVHPPELRGRRVAERAQFLSNDSVAQPTQPAQPASPMAHAPAAGAVVVAAGAAAAASGGHIPPFVGVLIFVVALGVAAFLIWRTQQGAAASAPVPVAPKPAPPPAPPAPVNVLKEPVK